MPAGRKFLNNSNSPIRCNGNGYTKRPPRGLFFSKELNEKWDKKVDVWDRVWSKPNG